MRQVEVNTDPGGWRDETGGSRRLTSIVRRKGQPTLLRIGLRFRWTDDFYHRTLRMSWKAFLAAISAVYFGANLLFGLLYYIQPGSIMNARPGYFRDAFFFSVETFGTIGYGVLAPATDWANSVMTAETLCGLTLVALTTGMMFARISRPTARVLFSKVVVVTNYDGVPTLMARLANERTSQILQVEVGIALLRNERSSEGHTMRRFYDLKLDRERSPIFALSFTAMHKIDAASPFYGMTREKLDDLSAELLVTVTGLDETMAQTVHARVSYRPEEIMFGHRYADIFGVTPDGRSALDYRRFHLTEEVLG